MGKILWRSEWRQRVGWRYLWFLNTVMSTLQHRSLSKSVIPVLASRRLFTQREHNLKQIPSNLRQTQSRDWFKLSPNAIIRIVVCSRKCHWTLDMERHVLLWFTRLPTSLTSAKPCSNLSIILSKIDNCIIITFWIYPRYWMMWICTYQR